ncbi:MAG: hypothetical protein RR554_09340, partial [Vagococcus sp.]|uniref:hypothetical protein n=1 Tax=Vagococcus sp. TaxID=1933889 RepID=UPI002FC93B0E
MKKNDKKDLLQKQPVLKNVSLVGATMMISSSVLIPGLTSKAYADAVNDSTQETSNKVAEETTTSEETSAKPMTINAIEAPTKVKETENKFDLNVTLDAHRVENLDTIIQVSPNVNLEWNETKNTVLDETGNSVGTYTFDSQLNQVKVSFTKTNFTQAKLIIPISFKKLDLTEQAVTLSIGESVLSKNIQIEREEKVEETTPTSEIIEETTESKSSETTTESTIDSSSEEKVDSSTSEELK